MSSSHAHRSDYSTDRRVLFISALAVFIGVCGVGAAYLLLHLIQLCTNLFFYQSWSFDHRSPADHHLGAWVILVPAIGGLIVGLMARFGSEKIRGHGIPEAMEAILFAKSKLSPKVALFKPLSSGVAIGSGNPFGAEGPIIMTGGATGSLIAQFFHLNSAERKALLAAGACAGMTAVFGTPLAAVLLAVELLLFEMRPRSLLPVIVACAAAGFLRPLIIAAGPLYPLSTPDLTLAAMPIAALVGLVCGAAGILMTHALYKVEDGFARLPIHWMWWPAVGGLCVGIGGYFEPRALGIGYDVIGELVHNQMAVNIVISLILIKAVIWVLALGSGTSGGVLAPLLMVGAGIGICLSPLFPEGSASLCAVVGMASMLAVVMGVPLTAVVFVFGITHDSNSILPSLVGVGIAYGIAVLTLKRSMMTEKIARRGLHVYREYGVDPLERLYVSDVMTLNVVTLDADMRVEEVLRTHFGLDQAHRAFPVLRGDELVGMADRELLKKAEASARIGDLFKTIPAVAYTHDSCRNAMLRMTARHSERLPVVEEDSRRLIGIVSRSDLVEGARSILQEETGFESTWRAPQAD